MPFFRLAATTASGDDLRMKHRHSPGAVGGHCRGVTLLELLAVLGIVATLITAAIPSFREQRASAVATASANNLLTTLYHARTVALMRGRPTVVCLSADGAQCALGREHAIGWIAFQNDHTESPPRRDATEALLATQRFGPELRLTGSRQAVTYWPVSRAGTTATFSVCAGSPVVAARAVIVSQNGRPRTKTLAPRDAPCRS